MQYAEYYVQFFTATILEWKHLLKQDQYKDIIVESLRYFVKEQRVKVNAFVIMNKAGLCNLPEEYKYSSTSFYLTGGG